MAYNLKELSERSGENQGGELRFDLPMLSIEGEEGYFRLKDGDKETKLEGGVEGVMLKIRCQYGAYFGNGERMLFTSEQDSASNIFDLIEVTKNSTGKSFSNKIDRGTGKQLKEKYPDLKFKQMIYFLLNDELVRLQVKGGSLTNLFRTAEQAKQDKLAVGYFQQFGKDEHKFQYWTQLEPESFEKEVKKGKFKTFYRIAFTKGTKLSEEKMEEVANQINYIFDKIQSIETAKAKRGERTPEPVQEQPPVESYDDGIEGELVNYEEN